MDFCNRLKLEWIFTTRDTKIFTTAKSTAVFIKVDKVLNLLCELLCIYLCVLRVILCALCGKIL